MNKIKKRRLKNKITKNRFKITFILLALFTLGISSGYAILNSRLDIGGTAKIGKTNEAVCENNITGTFEIINSWTDNTTGKNVFSGYVNINNNGDETIDSWVMKLVGPNDMSITINADVTENIDGTIEVSADSESVYSWNAQILPGQGKRIDFAIYTVEENHNISLITFNGCTIYSDGVINPEPEPEPDPDVELTGLSITPSEYTFEEGETAPLTANKTPSNASATLTWSSSDSSIVTVSNDGVITAIKEGNAIITVSSGDISATSNITVTKKEEEPPSMEGINVTFVKTAHWGSPVIQYRITIENTTDTTINKTSFKLGMPDGTTYTFWNPATVEDNVITTTTSISSGSSIEIYGELQIPEGYDSYDYLTPTITQIHAE